MSLAQIQGSSDKPLTLSAAISVSNSNSNQDHDYGGSNHGGDKETAHDDGDARNTRIDLHKHRTADDHRRVLSDHRTRFDWTTRRLRKITRVLVHSSTVYHALWRRRRLLAAPITNSGCSGMIIDRTNWMRSQQSCSSPTQTQDHGFRVLSEHERARGVLRVCQNGWHR